MHLVRNIYLLHNGDIVNSGYEVTRKINEHEYMSLVDENVTYAFCDSTNLFVKAIRNNSKINDFYQIVLPKDSKKIPIISTILESKFQEQNEKCKSCKKFKIEFDAVSNVWTIR